MKGITKPTLVIDKSIALENIRQMKKKADKSGVVFRPHFKTHQSAEIGDWFKQEGVDKITVSSVEMAYYFANHGWKDITIAFPLNIRELNEIIDLSRKLELSILISSEMQLDALHNAANHPINYYLKIDVGYHRSGLEINQVATIQRLIKKYNNKLKFKGLLSHFGNTYKAANKNEVIAIYKSGIAGLLTLKKQLTNQKELLISIGDTPACSLVEQFDGVDEIRPGNFVYYDLMQKQIGSCIHKQIAAIVACPVIDVYPYRNEVLIYGGAVHLSKEYVADENNNKTFGEVVLLNEKGWGKPLNKTWVKSLSQEHGIIATTTENLQAFKPGDLIGIVPVHSCLVANLLRKHSILNYKRKS